MKYWVIGAIVIAGLALGDFLKNKGEFLKNLKEFLNCDIGRME